MEDYRVEILAPQSHTVVFQAMGGTGTMELEISMSPTALTLNTFTRTGYSFSNWNTAPDYSGTTYADGAIYDFSADITLYAQWTANSYTVTFDANGGGTPVPATMSVTFGSAYGTLATTSRTGYTFAGWFTAASGGTQVIATDIVNTASDHTLYGQWTANTYTVTFDANGGSTPDPTTKPVTYGSAYGTLATTSRTGYTFVGWFTAASGGTQITSATLVATASDHTLYAQWTDLPTFTVTFDANGGTGTMAPQTASLPTALTLNSFERLGFSFIGWNTVAGGGGTAFANGATYDFDADITLFAQWQIENHTITFNSNGGTGSMTTQISNIPTAITLNTFTRTGFNFTGWNTAANGAGTPYANGAVYSFSADITLYAQWSSMPTHAINLNAGWNLVSFNLIPADPDIEVVLADVLDDVILVYAWNGQTSSWLHFDPDVTYGNNLTELDEGMGFWINMAEDATLPISGTEPTTTAIPLYTGWNLIGYPSEAIGVLPDALDGITGKYNLVMAYHAADTADPWKLYEPGVPAWVTTWIN